MDSTGSLSAIARLDTDVSVAGEARRLGRVVRMGPRALGAGKLLVPSLVLNAVLLVGATAVVLTFRSELVRLSHRAQLSAQASARDAESLSELRDQTRALQAALVDLREAVSKDAEETLFLKVVILKPGVDHALARRIASTVHDECRRSGQDPNLVLAIMAVESNFEPRAVSPAGAIGLMQVMPLWRDVLGLRELAEPETSIRAGVQILTEYQRLYWNLDLAVTAYNAGPGTVDRALERGANPVNGYAAKVLALRERLQAIDVASRL